MGATRNYGARIDLRVSAERAPDTLELFRRERCWVQHEYLEGSEQRRIASRKLFLGPSVSEELSGLAI